MESQPISPHPSIIHSYQYGWQQMKKYFLPLLLIAFIVVMAEIPQGLADVEIEDGFDIPSITALHVLGVLYWLLILPVIQYGATYLYLKTARNQEFRLPEIFDGFSKYFNVVLANLLTLFLVGLGIVMFIIPGIIVLCRLAFVPYLVMDLDLGPIEAVERSWKMTKGHGWTIFGMGLMCIPIVIAGLLLLFVGVIFSVMWIQCAFAGLYYAVSLEWSDPKANDTVEVS